MTWIEQVQLLQMKVQVWDRIESVVDMQVDQIAYCVKGVGRCLTDMGWGEVNGGCTGIEGWDEGFDGRGFGLGVGKAVH